MSEKRFIISKNTSERSTTGIIDVEKQDLLWVSEVVDLLNEQQATIQQLKERNAHNFAKKMQLMKEIKELKAQLREKEREERLYANEILELRETNKEHIKFKSLGGDY